MKKLIGLMGKKRAGKDTVGKILMDHLPIYGIAYATKLKAFIAEMYAPYVTDAHLNGDLKEEVIPEIGCSTRYLMQEIGEGLREIDPSIWMRPIDNIIMINPTINFVITDLRHDNEMMQVWRHGGEVWEVIRDTGLVDEHKSENGITLIPDVQILNNGTIEDLENLIAHIWTEEN